MKLTQEEKETIIRFDDSSDAAEIYTCNQAWIKRLDKLAVENKAIVLKFEDKYSKTYICPKKWIKIKSPRVLTEEERLKLANRAKANFLKTKTANEEQPKDVK